jgi:N-acetylmuramoyl-L-alanine amidase
MSIFISAGHNLQDPGASGNGLVEAVEARKVRDKIISFISAGYTIVSDQDDWTLAKTMENFATGEGSACLDIHFNAGPVAATGVEVIHPEKASVDEIHFAKALSKRLSDIMKIKDRGSKSETETARGRLGMMRENGINLLVEICFISNPNDVAAYKAHFDELCEACANILMQMDDKFK